MLRILYTPNLGLVGMSDSGGFIKSYVDGAYAVVFATGVTQIAIQDSNRAWATDGDSLYLGTKGWTSWRTAFADSTLTNGKLTLVRATPAALFVYSAGNMYRTVGDTMLVTVQGLYYGDSITAMDYISDSTLIAVSASDIYRSTDGGMNWTLELNKMKGSASVFADTMHHLVFTGGDNLRVSSDSGQTWTNVVPPQEFGILNIDGQVIGARDCSGTFYILSGIVHGGDSTDMMRSQDDGNSFDDVGRSPIFPDGTAPIGGWVFDRGSTVFLKFNDYQYGNSNYFDFSVSYLTADR